MMHSPTSVSSSLQAPVRSKLQHMADAPTQSRPQPVQSGLPSARGGMGSIGTGSGDELEGLVPPLQAAKASAMAIVRTLMGASLGRTRCRCEAARTRAPTAHQCFRT
jgi:hypothetical protein